MKYLFHTLLLCSLCVVQAFGQSVLLEFQPKKGEDINYEISIKNQNIMEFSGASMTQTNDLGMGYEMKAIDIDKTGNVDLEQVFTYMTMNMQVPMMGDMVYDSRKGAGDNAQLQQMDKQLKPLFNKPFVTKHDKTGKVIEQANYAEVFKGIDPNIATQMRETNQQLILVYPDKKLKVGDTFKGELVSKTVSAPVYTVLAIEQKTVLLKVQMEIAVDVQGQKMQGTSSGEITVDRKTGVVIESTSHVEMEGKVNQMGQEIDFTSKIDMLLKRI